MLPRRTDSCNITSVQVRPLKLTQKYTFSSSVSIFRLILAILSTFYFQVSHSFMKNINFTWNPAHYLNHIRNDEKPKVVRVIYEAALLIE